MKSLTTSTILYAAEAMVNIKEADYRVIESKEKSLLINVFQTKIS